MKLDILLGLQWGDEGKGKIVDVLTPKYDIIARFQGGPNAGHSLEFNEIKHVLHTIPSGIFRKNKLNIIGNGVVIDPIIFHNEIKKLENLGVETEEILMISKKAHLILPTHKILDAILEKSKGKTKIGSTLKGIGPTYVDKIARNGLRVGDILNDNFKEKYNLLKNKHKNILKNYDFEYSLEDFEKDFFLGIETLKKFQIIDSEYYVNNFLENGKKILAEGAQGTLLDIDFGSYPYVTSSNTFSAGACVGLGVSPKKIGDIYGITKAYCTRVGRGGFPSELFDEDGEKLQKYGKEFGATTGRKRRCGWLDLVALKYSIMINGVNKLIISKIDVLTHLDYIKVAVAYEIDGKIVGNFPFDINQKNIHPIYKKFEIWKSDISNIKSKKDFPKELKNYINFIEKELKVPIKIISLGANRNSTVFM
ncbi:MAG: adenylosuccinate synthase [Bacteroidetes bacterium 4572_128]|nr:MAG: adenylosuccinate synthase [Bacteroidetes bacterium 4572_128]